MAESNDPGGDFQGRRVHTGRPEWVDSEPDCPVHSSIVGGDMTGAQPRRPQRRRSAQPEPASLVAGIRGGSRATLARAITMVESNRAEHRAIAQAVLSEILEDTGGSIRVGITGTPGAGKSTFIEALGVRLCEQGHRLAVLAIDPTSSVSGGSILGDKTRMEQLSRHENAFIRPSPSGGALGGVAQKSRETLLLCEAAGYDVIFVETVGVGQNEVAVRSMVDFFLLLMIAGGGDDLQGIKKGVIELADLIAVNKADGDNTPRALSARAELGSVLRYLQPATPGWKTRALTCSARTGDGIGEIWDQVRRFRRERDADGGLRRRRAGQQIEWMHALIAESLKEQFYRQDSVRSELPDVEKAVAESRLSPLEAAGRLLGLD